MPSSVNSAAPRLRHDPVLADVHIVTNLENDVPEN